MNKKWSISWWEEHTGGFVGRRGMCEGNKRSGFRTRGRAVGKEISSQSPSARN